MRLILLGGYAHDHLESMDRFVAVLAEEMARRGIEVTVLRPEPVFGRLKPAAHGLGKWLGYLDKYVVFPRRLRKVLRRAQAEGDDFVVHIGDHSNAIWTRYLQGIPHLVTCHDLLAVRSARGDFPENRVSRTGRLYQRLILAGLRRAWRIASVSRATAQDLQRLAQRAPERDLVVLNGLNHPYTPQTAEQRAPVLRRWSEWLVTGPYLLHVGGNQWYKNRAGVARIFRHLCARGNVLPLLVFAGQAPTEEVLAPLREAGQLVDVISTGHCSSEDLQALYSGAAALLFPSLAEGFGWPIIEAQTCGCRVVTSDRQPMAEIAGPSAVTIDPADELAAAEQIEALLLESAEARAARVAAGLANAARFSLAQMIDGYIAAYQTLRSPTATVAAA